MAAINPTATTSRHILGDVIFRAYSVPAVVNDGDTMIVPQTRIENAFVTPTTSVAIGITFQSNTPSGGTSSTLTFKGGPWTGRVGVFSRIG